MTPFTSVDSVPLVEWWNHYHRIPQEKPFTFGLLHKDPASRRFRWYERWQIIVRIKPSATQNAAEPAMKKKHASSKCMNVESSKNALVVNAQTTAADTPRASEGKAMRQVCNRFWTANGSNPLMKETCLNDRKIQYLVQARSNILIVILCRSLGWWPIFSNQCDQRPPLHVEAAVFDMASQCRRSWGHAISSCASTPATLGLSGVESMGLSWQWAKSMRAIASNLCAQKPSVFAWKISSSYTSKQHEATHWFPQISVKVLSTGPNQVMSENYSEANCFGEICLVHEQFRKTTERQCMFWRHFTKLCSKWKWRTTVTL